MHLCDKISKWYWVSCNQNPRFYIRIVGEKAYRKPVLDIEQEVPVHTISEGADDGIVAGKPFKFMIGLVRH